MRHVMFRHLTPVSLIAFLGMAAVGCLKSKKPSQTSDAGIAIPQAATELGIETDFLMKTYSKQNLEKRAKPGQLVAMVKSEWRDSLPLKHRSGDVKTFRNSAESASITAVGGVEVNGLSVSKNMLKLKNEKLGTEGQYEVLRLDLRDISSKGLAGAINSLHAMGSIVLAEPNFEMNAIAIPNDAKWPTLWGMQKISAPTAWDNWKGDANFTVAVIDTGIDYNHEDLKDNIWKNTKEIAANNIDDDGNGYVDDVLGWNFYWANNNPMDGNGHGTHCAGTVAGRGNNALGVAGVSWEAKLMPVKVLGDDGSGYNFDIYDGIMYAVNNGAQVTSNSYGGGGASSLIATALNAAKNKGVLFIAAAGNESAALSGYPAYYSKTYDNVISVASTDSNDALSSFSNYGDGVNIAAPGRDILSTVPNNGYQSYSGTSMATPHVAGLAALVWSKQPNLTYLQVKDALLTTGDAIPALIGKVDSGTRINAQKALEKAMAPTPTAAPTTPAPTPTAAPTTPAPTPTAAPTTPAPTPTAAPITPAPTPTAAPTTPAPTPTAAPTTPAPTPTAAPTTPAPTPTAAPTTPAPTPTPAPTQTATPVPGYKAGIRYSYFTTPVTWTDIPNFSRMSPLKAGLLQNFSIAPRTQTTNYGFSFTGFVQVLRAGTFTFYTNSDDGSRLWINGTLVVENGGTHGWRERSGSINLPVGYHAIKVDYFQGQVTQGLEVHYKGPGITKRKIPNSVLFYN